MRDSNVLTVLYEKSTVAQEIEKNTNVVFDPIQETPFDNFFYLRNCSLIPIEVDNNPVSIDTGLYFQLTNPSSEIFIRSYSNILREKNIGVLNSHFDYDYRNEVKVILYNYGTEKQIVEVGEIVGSISFYLRQNLLEVKKVPMVFPGEKYPGTKDNNWVQQEKKIAKESAAIASSYEGQNQLPQTEEQIKQLTKGRLR